MKAGVVGRRPNALVRRLVPYSLLPLSLIACALASGPWLRAFPSSVLAVPLFGATLLSVLTPLVVVGIGVRRLWITTLVDLALGVFYELLVTLRDPAGFDRLWSGLVHGPSQILTFALPLVSPRELMVAPVALCWLTGALVGECVARGWHSPLPYLALMVTFGLSYAGTARAITTAEDGRRYDILLGGTLLLVLLLLRAAQSWVAQDESADFTQPEGLLPLRGLATGAVLAIGLTALASAVVQSSAFTGAPTTPARTPPVDEGRPLSPVSFVSGLRPTDPKTPGKPLFRMTTDHAGSRYVTMANVDFYDGDGWSFNRTFRPSGGLLPNDADVTLRPKGDTVTQTYTVLQGPLTRVPWMPYENRVQRVSGIGIDIDPDSGMVVPTSGLRAGRQYVVQSRVPARTFDQLGHSARIGTSAPASDLGLAGDLQAPLATLVQSLAKDTGAQPADVVAFLQAVARDFRNDALAGGPATPLGSASPGPSSSASATPRRSSSGSASAPSPSLTPTASSSPHTGGTAFADVLASIRGARTATPEQYATLTALIARKLLVPVRVVTGFRLPTTEGSATLPAGSYTVTSAEAWTWLEIPVRGQGWVVLDPSPGTYADQQQTPPSGTTAASTPAITPSQTARLTNGNDGNAIAPPSSVPHRGDVSAISLAVIVTIVVLATAIAVTGALLARKWARRRRRRRSRDPRRRLLGAWQESLDLLMEAGLPELGALTATEVAEVTGDRFGPEPAEHVRALGSAANVAIFSPASPVAAQDAEAAWHDEAALARSVRRRLSWRRRMGTQLRYHRRRRAGALVSPTSWTSDARARATATRSRGRHRRR